jgi:ferrochelatase
VVAILTSAYFSYSSCRQYREDLARAVTALAEEGRGLEVAKVRHFFNHPGFFVANADAVEQAVGRLGAVDAAHLVFVTHSVPLAMAETAGGDGAHKYEAEHRDVATVVSREVAERTGRELPWSLVYCSRSGPPSQPWLEPDVNDHVEDLAAQGVTGVVLAPIGFVSDHMEVKYDLDTEAAETAQRAGLRFERAATAGTHPAFVAGLVDLVLERIAAEAGQQPDRPTVGELAPWPDQCPAGCCPNLRQDRPAACGQDWVQPVPLAAGELP